MMWKQELPTFAGVALIVIAVMAAVAKLDLSASETVLALFGAALVAAPVIARIKIGSGGVEFETKVKETTYPMYSISTRRPSSP